MKRFVEKVWPGFIILTAVTLIALTNNIPHTFLTGGDNLHPEFNFGLNIKRSIFSVWEEYQGVGLLAGMGHAADLPRQIFLYVMSAIVPTENIRYFWTILTLLIGALGAYFLIERISRTILIEKKINIQLISLTGALFYLLNLATLQQYYTPFEVFTAHFAFLPWLILTAINYFLRPTLKNLFIASFVLLISTPGAYVPTLFVVYLFSAGLLSLFLSKGEGLKIKLGTITKFFSVAFIVNSFWLLPFIYFTITNSSTVVNSKISELASTSIFLQNKEFGGIKDVMLLKGFWFNNVEPNYQGTFVYMLEPWRQHLSSPVVQLIGYLLFGIILFGLIQTLRKKSRLGVAFAALFIFSFTMLTTATPPFSWIVSALRNHLPLFGEVFRFPFTKFSVLAGLSYSIFLAIGIFEIASLLKRTGTKFLVTLTGFAIAAIVIFSLPTFKGDFFYYKEQIGIPSQYFSLFNYLKNQDQNIRIADFPQYQNWEWNFYKWGYSGSGFAWYGINEPILSRTFDTWSNTNENYYWELTNAMYAKDPVLFNEVLNKYSVSKFFIDNSIVSSTSEKELFVPDLKKLISQIPTIKHEKNFGSVEFYSHALLTNQKSFIYTTSPLSSVNPYKSASYDQAYDLLSDYSNSDKSDIYYPFRSALFSRKSQKDIDYKMVESAKNIDFIKELPETKDKIKLTLPSPIDKNNNLSVSLFGEIKNNKIIISYRLNSPTLYLKQNGKTEKVWETSFRKQAFTVSSSQKFPVKINVNGASIIPIEHINKDGETALGTATFSVTQNNYLVLSDKDSVLSSALITGGDIESYFNQDLSSFTLKNIAPGTELIARVPKVEDKFQGNALNATDIKNSLNNCDNFRNGKYSTSVVSLNNQKWLKIQATNATPCISTWLGGLDHDQGYAIFVNTINIKGRGIHFWVSNSNSAYNPIETYLPEGKNANKSGFVLSPMEKFGQGYSMHFDNGSIGGDETVNDLGQIDVFPIPYQFLSSISLGENNLSSSVPGPNFEVAHPNQSIYALKISASNKPYTLIQSQGYDKGWQAYEIKFKIQNSKFKTFLAEALPFIFGKRIDSHVMVNNWENGWKMQPSNSQSSIVIVYLPQYLEYFGFLALIIFFAGFGIVKLKRKKNIAPVS